MRRALFCLSLFLLAQAARADEITCVRKTKTRWLEPGTLNALLDCHRRQSAENKANYLKKHGRTPPKRSLDEIDEMQSAEVRGYLNRHPDRASTGDEEAAERELENSLEEIDDRSFLDILLGRKKKEPEDEVVKKELRQDVTQRKGMSRQQAAALQQVMQANQAPGSANMGKLLNSIDKKEKVINASPGLYLLKPTKQQPQDYDGLADNVDQWLIDTKN